MKKVSTMAFGNLKNAEHVSLFTNVCVAINKVTISALGLPAELFKKFTDTVDIEQDIVNHSTGSVYTPEMQAMDAERDRLFRLIRLKLQAATYANKNADVYALINSIEKNLLGKYSIEITTAPYQEESALIRGFILDVRNLFDEDEIAMIGITGELDDLESYNNAFANQYNERVAEKSVGTTEATKKARKDTEEVYSLIALHLEYTANTNTTDVGVTCGDVVGIINELIKDAKLRLNQRLGKVDTASAAEEE